RTYSSPALQENPSLSQLSKSNSHPNKLEVYIDWLAKKNPTLAESLKKCKELLLSKDIIYKTLPRVSDEDFEKWNILRGIRLLLRMEKENFVKVKAKGHV